MVRVIEHSVPSFVVFLHRLTRMGGASNVVLLKTATSLSRFNVTEPKNQYLQDNFPALKDAEVVWLQYREKEAK